MSPHGDMMSPHDEQPPDAGLAPLAHGPEAGLAAGRPLPGHEAQPGGEAAAALERAGAGREGRDGARGDGADARDGAQAPELRVRPRRRLPLARLPLARRSITCAHLRAIRSRRSAPISRTGSGRPTSGRPTSGRAEGVLEHLEARRPLRRPVVRSGPNSARRPREPRRAAARAGAPGAGGQGAGGRGATARPCVSAPLSASRRTAGREAASAIASASAPARSLFCLLHEGRHEGRRHEGRHEGRRREADLATVRPRHPAPAMGRGARLHRHLAGPPLRQPRRRPRPRRRLVERNCPIAPEAADLDAALAPGSIASRPIPVMDASPAWLPRSRHGTPDATRGEPPASVQGERSPTPATSSSRAC